MKEYTLTRTLGSPDSRLLSLSGGAPKRGALGGPDGQDRLHVKWFNCEIVFLDERVYFVSAGRSLDSRSERIIFVFKPFDLTEGSAGLNAALKLERKLLP